MFLVATQKRVSSTVVPFFVRAVNNQSRSVNLSAASVSCSTKGLRVACVGSVWKSWRYLRPGFEKALGAPVTSRLLKDKFPGVEKVGLTLVIVEDTSAVGASLYGARYLRALVIFAE